MNRHKLFSYVKTKYNTIPDYPWFDISAILRHRSNYKWHGLVIEVGRNKLRITGADRVITGLLLGSSCRTTE